MLWCIGYQNIGTSHGFGTAECDCVERFQCVGTWELKTLGPLMVWGLWRAEVLRGLNVSRVFGAKTMEGPHKTSKTKVQSMWGGQAQRTLVSLVLL